MRSFHAAEDEDTCGDCLSEFKDQLAAEGEDTDVLFKFVKKVLDVVMHLKGSATF